MFMGWAVLHPQNNILASELFFGLSDILELVRLCRLEQKSLCRFVGDNPTTLDATKETKSANSKQAAYSTFWALTVVRQQPMNRVSKNTCNIRGSTLLPETLACGEWEQVDTFFIAVEAGLDRSDISHVWSHC